MLQSTGPASLFTAPVSSVIQQTPNIQVAATTPNPLLAALLPQVPVAQFLSSPSLVPPQHAIVSSAQPTLDVANDMFYFRNNLNLPLPVNPLAVAAQPPTASVAFSHDGDVGRDDDPATEDDQQNTNFLNGFMTVIRNIVEKLPEGSTPEQAIALVAEQYKDENPEVLQVLFESLSIPSMLLPSPLITTFVAACPAHDTSS